MLSILSVIAQANVELEADDNFTCNRYLEDLALSVTRMSKHKVTSGGLHSTGFDESALETTNMKRWLSETSSASRFIRCEPIIAFAT